MSDIDLARACILVSGTLHAIINAILKAGSDKLVGRALIDGSTALLALPALAFVEPPAGAWGLRMAFRRMAVFLPAPMNADCGSGPALRRSVSMRDSA